MTELYPLPPPRNADELRKIQERVQRMAEEATGWIPCAAVADAIVDVERLGIGSVMVRGSGSTGTIEIERVPLYGP